MLNVRIEENDLLDLLMERLEFWSDDETTIKLYEEYYQSLIDSGSFDGMEINVNEIVDNDYINWFWVMDEEELKTQFNEDEEQLKDKIYASYDGYYLVYMC